MTTNYYTLQALVREWRTDLVGSTILDIYSQVRNALTIVLASTIREWSLRISVQAPHHYIFRSVGYNRARRNVASLFTSAVNRRVMSIDLAERDRVLFLELEKNLHIQINLYGPRANIFLVDAEYRILEAFQRNETWSDRPAPAIQSAQIVDTFETFEKGWRSDRRTISQALSSTVPFIDRLLASEVLYRAGVSESSKPYDSTVKDRKTLFSIVQSVCNAIEHPTPSVYLLGRHVHTFSLIELQHLGELERDSFATVDEAVCSYIRRFLGRQRFLSISMPVEKALKRAAGHYRQGAARLVEELAQPSRGDRYERWGHLLIATDQKVPPGAAEIVLPDLFGDQTPVTIPLEAMRSTVENAQIYYEKARRMRGRRERANEHLSAIEARAILAEQLLETLHGIRSLSDLRKFNKEHADMLATFTQSDEAVADRIPFYRIRVADGYEVWVGRNAKQNDLLTSRYAKKYDIWMHARGVKGSHVVLRLPDRNKRPGKHVLASAASVAAYYSKARGSDLVPVIVTERKWVRKPKGALPGTVVVEREEVLMVEPRLPVERSS